MVKMENIIVHRAAENNLKDISVTFPVNQFTCVIGPSGCGKSSLIYDTIYAESQRNFLDSMTGGFAGQRLMDKPHVDFIENLRPALNISQRYYNVNPRSTVGTVTDISYYLRTLFAFIHNQTTGGNIDISYFSPNVPGSCCPICDGMGEEYAISESALMPDPDKSLASGGIVYYKGPKTSMEYRLLEAICHYYGINMDKKVGDLTDLERYQLLLRTEIIEIPLRFKNAAGKQRKKVIKSKGVLCELQEKLQDIDAPSTRISIEKYLKKVPCSSCNGLKLSQGPLEIQILGKNISEIENFPLPQLLQWLRDVDRTYNNTEYYAHIRHLLQEIQTRAQHMIDLSLAYLSLGRNIPSLSSGELQRVRIANQLECSLCGLIYILDEPCVGLHYDNVISIIRATRNLVDRGNTVFAIEHNLQYICAADHIIEMGPEGGPNGGLILYEGPVPQKSHGKLEFKPNDEIGGVLSFYGISYHNLRNVGVAVPLGKATCITGVSGSGKSSLAKVIEDCCVNGQSQYCETTLNLDKIKRVFWVNQQPIGKTPRSTVVSYLGIYDAIRNLLADTVQAKNLALSPSAFSINTPGGRCECCQGTGKQKTALSYLPDTYITCPECKGKRFQDQVLSVQYQGYSVFDILSMQISDAALLFQSNALISNVLACVEEIGLGYLSLGQMSMNLSGGEAQRLKLAKHLSANAKGKGLYILDEPTTGLSDSDVGKLKGIIEKLLQRGETLLIIEHDLAFVAQISDYLIDLGCVAGEQGGRTVLCGFPQEVAFAKGSSWKNYLKNQMEEDNS